MTEELKQIQLANFFRYVGVSSQSNAANTACLPSSSGQLELAQLLASELKTLGLSQVNCNEHAIVTACLPKNTDHLPSIGFIAHLDTVDIGLSPHIHPQILHFNGSDVVLNEKLNIVFKVDQHPEIKDYLNEDIIFSDGTSVLGADDKAAIATIMTVLKQLTSDPIPHGDIYIAFVPDEEIGLLGAKALDLSLFKPDFAYTIDCCGLGEVVYETFNAGSAIVNIQGVTAHPMSAKGVLVNPILIAIDIANSFNRLETPEHTEGKEGYIWVQGLVGGQSSATLTLNIRDHDKKLYEDKKARIQATIQQAIKANPKATITLELIDVYGNIADSIQGNTLPIDVIYQAMENLNIKPKTIAMRGGTDGSALSVKGLLTPNYFTGAHNFHSIYEFLPLSSFHKSFELSLEIIKIISQNRRITHATVC